MGGKRVPVGIVGVAMAVPPRVVTNDDLAVMVDTSDDWIQTRTGIKARRVAGNQTTLDLAAEAGRLALHKAGAEPSEIDAVIVATVTPDTTFPSVSSGVQHRLGLPECTAFDLSAACSGFVYGLEVGSSLVETGRARRVLLIGADVLTRILDWTDRTTCVLFGDGAGAVVLAEVPEGYGLLGASLGVDGSGGPLLEVTAAGRDDNRPVVRMAGREVYRFAVRIQPEACAKALEAAGLTIDEVDWFVPHQANLRIIESARERLGVPPEKLIVDLDRYGNTSSASIPLALAEAVGDGRIKRGDVVLTLGFGAGLTWGAAVMRWY